jgi:nitronate monooxygenase
MNSLGRGKSLFQLQYPVILGPMAGGIVNPQLVSKVCNEGFLGFIPGGYLKLNDLEKFIVETKSLLKDNSLFGVNIFIESSRDNELTLKKSLQVLEIESKLNMKKEEFFKVPSTVKEEAFVDLIIAQSVPIASSTFGFFKPSSVQRLKAKGVKLIGGATSIDEVSYCLERGADAVVVQGTEAGGHQAAFLSNQKNEKKALDLLKDVKKQYADIPIIASGGISTKNLTNYLQNGADYVQLGTAFMLTHESSVSKITKEHIITKKQTVLTNVITGKWARGVKNQLIDSLTVDDGIGFPIQHYLTAGLRAEARRLSNPEYQSLWAGSNSENLQLRALEEVITEIKSTVKY